MTDRVTHYTCIYALVAASGLLGACRQREEPAASLKDAWSSGPTDGAIVQCLSGSAPTTIFPDAPGYEQARGGFNLRIQVHPGVIVQPVSIPQVQDAIKCARRLGMGLAVRSGGHSYEGYSLGQDGGMIIDMSAMTDLVIDKTKQTATVGPGWRLGSLYLAVWRAAHLTFAAGTCPTVGLAGHSLGGGYGMISRKFGLAADNILSLTMVDANGNVLTADPSHHPDLYWASRGGGGSFGVVVSFTIQLHQVPDTVAIFRYHWGPEATKAVVQSYQSWAPSLPPEAGAMMSVTAKGVTINGLFLGPAARAATLAAPVLTANPGYKTIELDDVPFLESVLFYGDLPRGDPGILAPERLVVQPVWFKAKSVFVDTPLPAESLDMITQALASTTLLPDLIFDAYGGVINQVPPDATAFPHRSELFSLQIFLEGDANIDANQAMAWVSDLGDKLAPYASHFAVPNYIDAQQSDWQNAYYGSNFQRLVAVKKRYDPDDVFHFAQSIPTHYP